MSKNGIFIAATAQHVGKTTACLGVLSGLMKRYSSIGFMKPVGQRHVRVKSGIHVDKDVALFKEYFHLEEKYSHMSPVILPRGFTRDYLDGKHPTEELTQKILQSYENIQRENEFTLVEGTGHVGVGSIVNLSNAKVASLLGLDMVIVSLGGLGSSFDELALNRELCLHYGVKIRGVLLNKVRPDKLDMVKEYFPKALARWEIPLLGVIPFRTLLSQPSMADYENLFQHPLLSGHQHRYRHFHRYRLGARSIETFRIGYAPNELVITPAGREDIIHFILERDRLAKQGLGPDDQAGIIVTGLHGPSPSILKAIKKSDVPVIYVPLSSYRATEMVSTFIAKIRKGDKSKVEEAVQTVEAHIDFDALCSYT